MKKLVTALCLMALGLNVQAGEHEHAEDYRYSIFQEHRFDRTSDQQKILNTQQNAREFMPGWNATVDMRSGDLHDMYGPVATVPGSTLVEKAQALMAGKLTTFGIEAAEWQMTRNTELDHAGFVDYKQVIDGKEVVFSRLSFRFTENGELQRVLADLYGKVEKDMVAQLTEADALNTEALTTDLQGLVLHSKKIIRQVWFPKPISNGYQLRPAWEFYATGLGEHEMPFDLTGYIDAITGELLYRTNEVTDAFDVTVQGRVYLTTPLAPTQDVAMPHMTVRIGGNNYTTDVNGYVNVANENAPVSVSYRLEGDFVDVVQGGSTPSFTATMNSSGTTYLLPSTNTSSADFRSTNAFYFGNVVHDYMKSHWPNFTGMDMPMRANVDINQNTCNAFYRNNNYSMNFYQPQTVCRAFSEVSDIVYHEYGHGISYRFYTANGANFNNGAMGEANSDVWSMSINKDGVVGEGAYYSGGSIRNYTGAPKVYPGDIRNQVHNDGEILAGSWWDVAQNTGSVDTMAKLFALTHYDVPNAPDGNEGPLYHDVLISALMNDDDDNNLGNGTPHFQEIVEAFARHGIYLLQDAQFVHNEVAHQKVGVNVTIEGQLVLANPAFFDKLYLVYRDRYNGTGWDTVIMNNTTANTYSAQIPGHSGGTIMDYYFSALDVVNASNYGLPGGYNPDPSLSGEVTLPYQFGFGINNKRVSVDFEGSIDGWELGVADDDATAGHWIQAVPIGTSVSGAQGSLEIQPGQDHTTGNGKCLVTANGGFVSNFSSDDIDGGKTTVRTPVFQLPFYEPVVEYYRWYSNDRGGSQGARNDDWIVQIKTPLALVPSTVERTRQADQQWRRKIFRVSEYLTNASEMQMTFIAQDAIQSNLDGNGQDIVEAAIDDFVIYEGAPVSVEEQNKRLLATIYPNPADEMITINVPQGSEGSISLYDITGKVLNQGNVTNGTTKYNINTTDLPSGTYMILIQTQHAVQNSKVVVSHQ